MPNSWIQIKALFVDPSADLSAFVDAFRNFGIENTLETGDSLTGCLPNVKGSREVAEELSTVLAGIGASDVEVSVLEEENWEEVWRRFFKPRRIGKRFVVRPTWEEFHAEPGDVVLVLDPGQAFGTGDHATTRMCLELLETIELTNRTLYDIGCGSGILSVAASKLGAFVSACDIDPLSVEVTRENAARNEVEFEIRVEKALGVDSEEVQQDETLVRNPVAPVNPGPRSLQFDVVVSNIISATLIRMSRQVAALTARHGSWIVSGIIEQNWPDVLSAAESADFRLVSELHEDGWVAARFVRL
jgi:ribosomal protein L11 methyltransferase